MLWRNFMSGAEMHFRYLPQCVWSAYFDQLFGGLFYGSRYAALQSNAKFPALALQPVDERFTRDDRCRRDRDIRFCSRPLFDDDVTPMPEQRCLDHSRI